MLTCFTLTVVFDMVIAVTVGVVLAALLFMRRMSMLVKTELETPQQLKIDVPAGIRVYEIAGPLFFGAAKSAMERCTPSATRTTRTSSTCATCRRSTRPASSRSNPCSTAAPLEGQDHLRRSVDGDERAVRAR